MSAEVLQNPILGGVRSFCPNIHVPMKFIRKMRGGSQSLLVECTDGCLLVVKMHGNPQGPNVLANEFLGTHIASCIGLPVSKGTTVYLSDRFIDLHPDLWFEGTDGHRRRPESGVHFGSFFIGTPDGVFRPIEYISRSRISLILNRTSFLGMYLLDVWANHQDSRQALLLTCSEGGRESIAYFIDHGHMFGGPKWEFSNRPNRSLHLERSVYADLLDANQITSWLSRLKQVLPESISEAISLLPNHWYTGNCVDLYNTLLYRLANIEELLEMEGVALGRTIVRGNVDDNVQIPCLGLHALGAAL